MGTIEEYRFRMILIHRVMKKRLLGKIPLSLMKKTNVDEQSSILMGLLEDKEVQNKKMTGNKLPLNKQFNRHYPKREEKPLICECGHNHTWHDLLWIKENQEGRGECLKDDCKCKEFNLKTKTKK